MSGMMGDGDLGLSYRASKSGSVFIERCGRVVTDLRKGAARDFLGDIDGACFEEGQMLMARYTGNYKRGNERPARLHPRRGA
jgi:hypothetical protein